MIIKNNDTVNQTTRHYKPKPHPMQHRLDEFRKLPSMWCGVTYHTPEELALAIAIKENRTHA